MIRLVAAIAAALAALAVAAAGGAPGGGEAVAQETARPDRPRCFGAASRDPRRRCENRALRLRVVPTPTDALLDPPAPCTKLAEVGLVKPCAFGVPAADAREQIALIGDSHAGHWRAAVDRVAAERGARGTSITRASCPFTQGDTDLPEPARSSCRRWNDQVLAWLRRHPEVSIVLLSSQAAISDRREIADRDLSFTDRVRGHREALRAMPRSVRRAIVVRDVPRRSLRTLDCVERAMSRRRPAGTVCAPPRGRVLERDPAAVAAERMGGRFREADLSAFFCARRCPPVVGGVLVHKDEGHMTTTYAETLGPYLLRRVNAVAGRPPRRT